MITLFIVASILLSRSPLLSLHCLPICPSLMFQTGIAVCGLVVQTLLNYVTSLYLLLIVIFQGRNEKGKTSY